MVLCNGYLLRLVALGVGVALRGERVALLVVEVLLEVEERVEEDGRHLAALQVVERHLAGHRRVDHVEHLSGTR